MAKFVIAIIAIVASFMMVESLTCKTCSYGVGSFCLSSSTETCGVNMTSCAKTALTFSSFSSLGFSTLGCRMAAGCNTTTAGTVIGLTTSTVVSCCESDNCVSGAPSTKMTLTAVIGVAVLASMWSSIM